MAHFYFAYFVITAAVAVGALIAAGAKHKGHHVMDPLSCYLIAAAAAAAAVFFIFRCAVNLRKSDY
jgi:hypothetical protein